MLKNLFKSRKLAGGLLSLRNRVVSGTRYDQPADWSFLTEVNAGILASIVSDDSGTGRAIAYPCALSTPTSFKVSMILSEAAYSAFCCFNMNVFPVRTRAVAAVV
jgi:hypothetical protein